MSNSKNSTNEYVTFSSLLEENGLNEKSNEETVSDLDINHSYTYSIPTSSMYYENYNSSDDETYNRNGNSHNPNNNNKNLSSNLTDKRILYENESENENKGNVESIASIERKNTHYSSASSSSSISAKDTSVEVPLTNVKPFNEAEEPHPTPDLNTIPTATTTTTAVNTNNINNINNEINNHSSLTHTTTQTSTSSSQTNHNNKIMHSTTTNTKNTRKSSSSSNSSRVVDRSSVIVEISIPDKENEEEEEVNHKPTFPATAAAAVAAFNVNNRASTATYTSEDFTYINSSHGGDEDDDDNDNNHHHHSGLNPASPNQANGSSPIPFHALPSLPSNNNGKELKEVDLGVSKEHTIDMTHDEEDEEDNLCAICLIETKKPTDIENKNGKEDDDHHHNLSSNETVVNQEDMDDYECKLHCNHKFHYSCIAQWLERNQVCPICRMEIKKYEIEAIEKRFSISIHVKEDSLPLERPRYNLTLDFDLDVTTELVQNYFQTKFPWINMKVYFYTRFLIYFLFFLGITVFGLALIIAGFVNGDSLGFNIYVIELIFLIYFIIFILKMWIAKKTHLFFQEIVMKYPTGCVEFYQLAILVSLLIFIGLGNSINDGVTNEFIYQNVIVVFCALMIVVCCVEGKTCLNMLKQESNRMAEEEANRRNEEIRARAREAEAQEREEFERNFSNLN